MSAATRRRKPEPPWSGRVLLIEQAQALGEPPEDPLLLFSVLYGLWVANLVAFNGDVMRELAIQFLALAEKQSATGPLMIAHRQMGLSLLHTGDIADGRAHLDHAIALYDPGRASISGDAVRSGRRRGKPWPGGRLRSWLLGYPDTALADAERALEIARESAPLGDTGLRAEFQRFSSISCAATSQRQTRSSMNSTLLKDQIGGGFWGGWGIAAKRLRIDPDRKGRGSGSKHRLRHRRNAINRKHDVDAVVFVTSGAGQRRRLVNSIRPGATFAKR